MADIQQTIKDNFAQNLKASEYFAMMNTVWEAIPDKFRFMMNFIHEIFNSRRFSGSKLLEIGSGATVHSIAAASAYFPNIVQSDYVEDNVQQLKRWLRGDSNLVQLLDIPSGLEGYGNDIESGKKMLESRIRKSVKRVTRCDLMLEDILMDKADSDDVAPPFDVVLSCLCLETAPKDFSGFVDILKRINKLLRPGGGLIVCGFLQGGFWKVRETEFHHIKFSEKDLVGALVEAGFGNIYLKTIKNDMDEFLFEYDKLYGVAAEKL